MFRHFLTVFLLLLTLTASAKKRPRVAHQPKREFRGAWMQCVNGAYLGNSPQQIRGMLTAQLDVLERARINAVLFQVRPEGDALYASTLEPWSRFLTGRQGQAPQDGWDPLAWMVEQCHERGMECHAWINPYRMKTKGTTVLSPTHIAMRHSERTFTYGDQIILNPALEINRHYTCMVVEDLLTRYDVDGLHIDDYFYPYPVAGEALPDEADFRRDSRGFRDIGDWRRDNVNRLIEELHHVVHATKPWVKFGVSPFGIYRNNPERVNTPRGSATSGLQNYDDLYADIRLWAERGWVDYLIPQIYWNIGTRAADYAVLCNWWNDHCSQRPLFIGQDVLRTVQGTDPERPGEHQMNKKYGIQRALEHVSGSCQWYASALTDDPGGYTERLRTIYHRYSALQPSMPFIDKRAPRAPQHVRITVSSSGPLLTWEAPKAKKALDEARQYVVYDFGRGVKPDIADPARIMTITRKTQVTLPPNLSGHTILITALDRLQNESKAVKVKL